MTNPSIPTTRMTKKTFLHQPADDRGATYWRTKTTKRTTTTSPSTPESSGEHALFITQQDPEQYHEPGTLSRSEKGKTPAPRKRPSSTTNVWTRFGLSADSSRSAATSAPPAKRKPTAARSRGSKATRRTTREEKQHEGKEDSLQSATPTSTSAAKLWTIEHASDLSNMLYCRTH